MDFSMDHSHKNMSQELATDLQCNTGETGHLNIGKNKFPAELGKHTRSCASCSSHLSANPVNYQLRAEARQLQCGMYFSY